MSGMAARPPGLVFRLMGQADLQAYKQLRDAMIDGHEDAFTSDAATERQRPAESYRSRLGSAASPGGGVHGLFTLCAWQDGHLVGAVSAEREGRRKQRHLAHIVGMMVRDDCQRQGLGRALLSRALDLLQRDDTLEQVVLSVTRSNAVALRLYERLGFELYGCLTQAIKLPDGRYVDKALMRLDLRARRSTTIPRPGSPTP